MKKLYGISMLFLFLAILPFTGYSQIEPQHSISNAIIARATFDTILKSGILTNSNVLWEESDLSAFPEEGSNQTLRSTGVKSWRMFNVYESKLISTATTAYCIPMNATRTVPFSTVGAKSFTISILGATFSGNQWDAGTSVFGSSAQISIWGTPLAGTYGYGNEFTAGTPDSASMFIPLVMIPQTPGVAFSNIVYASPLLPTTAQPNLYYGSALPAASGIIYATQPGIYTVEVPGIRSAYIHCAAVYTTTAVITVNLNE